jgi:hypothetical protein
MPGVVVMARIRILRGLLLHLQAIVVIMPVAAVAEHHMVVLIQAINTQMSEVTAVAEMVVKALTEIPHQQIQAVVVVALVITEQSLQISVVVMVVPAS